MTADDVHPGDILQIDPKHHWDRALVIVSEVRPWGVIAYHVAPLTAAHAYIRLAWDDAEPTGGCAPWRRID